MILDVGCGVHPIGDVNVDLPLLLASDSGVKPGARTGANVFASAYNLPFRNHSFEVVHFHGLLHHLSDPGRAWAEMARVAKDMIVGLEPSFLNPGAWFDPFHMFKGFRRRQLAGFCSAGVSDARVLWIISLFPPKLNFQIVAFKGANNEHLTRLTKGRKSLDAT